MRLFDVKLPREQCIEDLKKVWGKNEYNLDKLLLQDSAYSSSLPLVTSEVLSSFARQAATREPSLLVSSLLTPVELNPKQLLRTLPVDEGTVAADTPEGTEAQEVAFHQERHWQSALGKSAITLKASDEQIQADSQGILRRLSEIAGAALARGKEKRCVDELLRVGTLVLDPTVSNVKSPTGRGATGAYNGSLVIGDVIGMVEDLLDLGHVADTFICNPRSALAWWGQQSAWRSWWGAASVWAQELPGSPSRATVLTPSGMPSPWRIILSRFVPRTDLIIASSAYLGDVLLDGDISHEGWDDPHRDIKKNKFTWRYGISINQPACVTARHIVIDSQAFDFGSNYVVPFPSGQSLGVTGDSLYSGVV